MIKQRDLAVIDELLRKGWRSYRMAWALSRGPGTRWVILSSWFRGETNWCLFWSDFEVMKRPFLGELLDAVMPGTVGLTVREYMEIWNAQQSETTDMAGEPREA